MSGSLVRLSSFELRFFVWCLAVFSTFIAPIKVYPLFFVAFIFSHILFVKKDELKIRKKLFLVIFMTIMLILTFIFAGIKGFERFGVIKFVDYFKMALNYSFLAVSLHFFSSCKSETLRLSIYFKRLFVLILLLSLFQLLNNIYQINFWTVPFDGSNNKSWVSYRLTLPGVLFGDLNKNIWSTKVIFFCIMLFLFKWKGIIDFKRFTWWLIVFLVLFFVVYSLSRTGQVVFATFLVVSLFVSVLESQRFRSFRLLFISFLLLTIGFLSQFVIGKVIHLDISNASSDGLASRIVIWYTFINHGDFINLLGFGVNSASHFISEYVGRQENNFHNVFINLVFESGLIGLLLFLLILFWLYFRNEYVKSDRSLSFVLLLPLLVCLNSHYVGYDADLVIYLINSYVVLMLNKFKLQM
ncbi:MAG: O-antigen ligase family protein [Cyclobacteriaceae bacterium]